MSQESHAVALQVPRMLPYQGLLGQVSSRDPELGLEWKAGSGSGFGLNFWVPDPCGNLT